MYPYIQYIIQKSALSISEFQNCTDNYHQRHVFLSSSRIPFAFLSIVIPTNRKIPFFYLSKFISLLKFDNIIQASLMALINPTEADLTRDKKVNWRKLTSANNLPVFASRYYRRHFIHIAIGYFLDIC